MIMDDADMLRELEELDRKTKLEEERAMRKKFEAKRAQEKKKKPAEAKGASGEKIRKQKDATLKARLERRRKRQIIITENKARETEAHKQLKAVEEARLQKESAEAEDERKLMAKRMAEEFTKRQEQAAAEAAVKKRIRLNQIKDAARRREAEEQSTKLQQLRSAELAEQRKKEAWDSEQKRRRDEEARIRQLRQMTDAKAQREDGQGPQHHQRGHFAARTAAKHEASHQQDRQDQKLGAARGFHGLSQG